MFQQSGETERVTEEDATGITDISVHLQIVLIENIVYVEAQRVVGVCALFPSVGEAQAPERERRNSELPLIV